MNAVHRWTKVKTSHSIFTVQHKFWHEEIKLTLVKDTLTAYYIEPNSGLQKLYYVLFTTTCHEILVLKIII